MPENSKTATDSPGCEAVLIYATFPSAAEAERIGTALIERRLIACINISAPITSLYVWDGSLHRDQEVAAVLKTRAGLAEVVVAEVCRMHTYANPAVVILPVTGGAPPFLAWIAGATSMPQ